MKRMLYLAFSFALLASCRTTQSEVLEDSQQQEQKEPQTYKIVAVDKKSFEPKTKHMYSVKLEAIGVNPQPQFLRDFPVFVLGENKIDLMIANQKLKSEKDLKGMTFESDVQADDITNTGITQKMLDEFLLNLLHDGNFKPLVKEELYKRLVDKLAKHEIPSFVDQRSNEVMAAMTLIYDDEQLFNKTISEGLNKATTGRERILAAQTNEANYHEVRGPQRHYKIVSSKDQSKVLFRFSFGPYYSPVWGIK